MRNQETAQTRLLASHDWLEPTNWVTPKHLAAVLHFNVQTIYNLISSGGDLPPIYYHGRMPRFFRPEVEAWLVRNRCVTASSRLRDDAA